MDTHTYSLSLVGATALLIDDRTSAAQRQDTFDSVLFAQLQTEKNYGTRFADYRAWARHYRDALVTRCWIPLARSGKYIEPEQLNHQAALQLLAISLRGQCPQAAQALATAVRILGQQAALPFTNPVEDGHSHYAAYELGILRPDFELLMCGLGLDRRPTTAGAPAPDDPYMSTWRGVLDEDAYEDMRDSVHAAIASKHTSHELITHLGALPEGDFDATA